MKFLTLAASGALGAALLTQSAAAQGPIRQGLRATGEAAADAGRAVVQGTGEVARGAVDATGQVVGSAAQAGHAVVGGAVDATGRVVGEAANATGAVVGGAAQGVRAGVNALTPGIPLQARAGASLSARDSARGARWRFARHNGEWWYYSPENNWQYHRDGRWNEFSQDNFQPNAALAAGGQFSGQYGAGFRGRQGAQARAQLQSDANGQFIIHNGQRIDIDGSASAGAGQSGLIGSGAQPTPQPSIPQGQATAGATANGTVGAGATVPAPAIPATTPAAGQ